MKANEMLSSQGTVLPLKNWEALLWGAMNSKEAEIYLFPELQLRLHL